MRKISEATHRFRRRDVPRDGSCLFWVIYYLITFLKELTIKDIRGMVANYIRGDEDLCVLAPSTIDGCKDIHDYCARVKDNLWGGELELRAFAMAFSKLIVLVSVEKNEQGVLLPKYSYYGEDTPLSECIYILYDEPHRHYEPLFICDKQNVDEKITVFKRNDPMVEKLLRIFIQEHLKCCIDAGSVKLADKTEITSKTNVSKDTKKLSTLTEANATANLRNKRKASEIDDIAIAQDNEKQLPLNISNDYYNVDKPTKSAKLATDQMPVHVILSEEKNSELLAMNELLQTNGPIKTSVPPVTKQSIIDRPIVLNDERRGEGKSNCRGEPLEAARWSYDTDRNYQHYLNLMIPEKYFLSAPAEILLKICLVKQDSNGNTYCHPDIKFQVESNGSQICYCNPIDSYLDNENNLIAYSEGIRQLKLPLAFVMLMNSELMKYEQSLTIVSSTNNTEAGITAELNTCDESEGADFPHDLHCVISLWGKQPGETEFRQYGDIQYINEISKKVIKKPE